MLTEDQMVNVLQKFADSFKDEINKLTIEVNELKQRVGMMKSAPASAPVERETQAVFQLREEHRPVAVASAEHPRTGSFKPGTDEVSIEKFFYSGGK